MSVLRIALIGAGNMARHHMMVMAVMPYLRAVGVFSRTRPKAEALAAEFGKIKVFDSIDDMMREAKPDALMVLVSETQAFDVASSVMKFGVPLFIEKPAGLTPEATKQLADMARRLNVLTMVGYNRRYYSLFHKGLDLVSQRGPLLGVFVQGHERFWRIREGRKFSDDVLRQWIYANSTHTIDLLHFLGGEAKAVMSMTRSFREASPDQMAAVMGLGDGTIGQYQAHWYSPGGWAATLYGDGITVEFKPLEKGQWTDRDFKTQEIVPDETDQKFKPGMHGQMKAFAALVRDRKKVWPMADLDDAYQTMRLAEQIIAGKKTRL